MGLFIPLSRNSDSILSTSSMGMAKTDAFALAVYGRDYPQGLPSMSRRAPPLLPGIDRRIGLDEIRINPAVDPEVFSRRRSLPPMETELDKPKGLPMTMPSGQPLCSLAWSP